MDNNQPKAVILLSSYNGEKYIRQQIESILTQTYSNFILYIRDDGSTDSTVSIIEELAKTDPRIKFIKDDRNLGYPSCFYYLTDTAPEADYYFFSDQDDVWLEDKIQSAIAVLENYDKATPVSYYSGYTICDSQMNKTGESPLIKRAPKLSDVLFQVCGLEFTMAINKAALRLLNNNKPSFCSGRGVWMCMLYASLGHIVIDNNRYALYRRHDLAVTASDMSFIGKFIWRIKRFFGGGFNDYREILQDFYNTVATKLSEKDYRMVRLFADKKYFPSVITKVFYPKRLRFKFIDELALRFTFLIGKL